MMSFYGPWFGWWVFPVIGLICLVVVLAFMFGPSGRFAGQHSWRGPGSDSDESGSRARASESALDILKRRYASGEITRDEYEQMRRDILS